MNHLNYTQNHEPFKGLCAKMIELNTTKPNLGSVQQVIADNQRQAAASTGVHRCELVGGTSSSDE